MLRESVYAHDGHRFPSLDFEVEVVQDLHILPGGIVEFDVFKPNDAFHISGDVLPLPVRDHRIPAEYVEYPSTSADTSHYRRLPGSENFF